jgi:hypothetical protein
MGCAMQPIILLLMLSAIERGDARVTSPVPDSLAPRNRDVTVVETRRATGPLGNDWRYVHHGGRHWYWMPNKTWTLWTGTNWEPYPADMANPGSSETQSHLQMQGYRQPVAPAGAYAVPGGETSSRPKQYKPRDGTLPLGERAYSPIVGPKQGLTPQDTKLLPQPTPDR